MPKRRAPSLNKLALFQDLGYEPHDGQRLVHLSRASRRILACGARWGKSTCASMEAIAAALQPCEKSLGWIVAPTYDTADRIFEFTKESLVRKLGHRVVDLDPRERRLTVRNLGGGLSELRAKSADRAVGLLGEGLDWVIVDEAASLKASVWEAHLSQRLIDRDGWALVISTPRGSGFFWDLFKAAADDPDCERWRFPSWSNPLLDEAVIERERSRLPDDVFRQEYAAEFLLDAPLQCKTCGCPKRPGEGPLALLTADQELGECPDCESPTDPAGTSVIAQLTEYEAVEECIFLRPRHQREPVTLPIVDTLEPPKERDPRRRTATVAAD